MKPTQFAYDRPETVDEALELLDEHHDAELLAGNQSLGIIMANRFASPERLVDINRLDDLAFVDISESRVEIGAMTRHRTLERHDELRSVLELVPESAEQIAGPAVRNRGTMGGSIAEADPAGNYPAVLAALGGELHVASVDGERTIPADDYFVGYMFTDLEENELITSVSFPRGPFPRERTGSAFVELKRGSQTWPTVSAATVVRVDDPSNAEPLIEESRLAVGNAAGIPLRIDEALAELAGEPLSDEALDSVAEAVRDAADPTDEMHADREYKTEMAGEYAVRSLRKSYERACGN